MTKPKIIQIAVERATDTTLFALTDDGRIFIKTGLEFYAKYHHHLESIEEPWQQIEPVPFEDFEIE